MDFLSLLTSSENLFKYLLIGGVGLLVLSVFYPINKRYELNCQKDLHNKEIKLLNFEIEQLNDRTVNLQEISSATLHKLDSINKLPIKNETFKNQLKTSFNLQLDSLEKSRHDVSVKQINSDYHKQQITTLDNHIAEFFKYETLFFYSGIVIALGGIIGWFILMKKGWDKP